MRLYVIGFRRRRVVAANAGAVAGVTRLLAGRAGDVCRAAGRAARHSPVWRFARACGRCRVLCRVRIRVGGVVRATASGRRVADRVGRRGYPDRRRGGGHAAAVRTQRAFRVRCRTRADAASSGAGAYCVVVVGHARARRPACDPARIARGRALATDRAAAPAARHAQSAWFRLRGMAARTQYPRDRILCGPAAAISA